MANYYRITAYHPTEDYCFIVDSHGRFEELWAFSSYLVSKGLKILEVSTEEKFLDGNMKQAKEHSEFLYIQAVQRGQPTRTTVIVDGKMYGAVEVCGRMYVPNREYREAMTGYHRKGIAIRDGFLYLQGQTNYQLRVPAPNRPPREIRHIALGELAAGMYEIIRQNISLDKASLFHLLAGKLGFTRAGNAIQEQLERALSQLRSVVDISGDTVSLK